MRRFESRPGATALTVTPFEPTSSASAWVNPTMPAFAAEYADDPGIRHVRTSDRSHIDDAPIAFCQHCRKEGLRDQECGLEAHCNLVIPFIMGDFREVLLQGRLCPGAHAGIVDENIDASEFRQKAIDIIGPGQIACVASCRVACGIQFVHAVEHAIRGCGQRNCASGLCQEPGTGKTNSIFCPRACDECS